MRIQDEELAVICLNDSNLAASRTLAGQLSAPMLDAEALSNNQKPHYFLAYRDGCLQLLDRHSLKKGGLKVEIEVRPGEQHSYPAPKKAMLAQAVGKKSVTVLDATAGWAQDSLALFRMGYSVTCIERSPVMAALIADGLLRLEQKDWVRNRQIELPVLLAGNAIHLMQNLPEPPDCIYLDPMFPPKRKKSALTKKSMLLLRDILGDDEDREELFAAAWQAAGRRVVVKSPDYAPPLAGKPTEVYQGKLLRYDVYIK
ncbi:MAG: class I SAM-dependent methyltransferase [Methylomonas sp.]|jgi:16S rRNA (guanine1516-N2)-methyltransferase